MQRFSPFTNKKTMREVLDRHGFYTKYSLGQNFLIDDAVVGKILDLSEVSSQDYVLEVGPGIGTLSWALLSTSCSLVSVEADKFLPPVLEGTLQEYADRFVLIEGDATKLKFEELQAAADKNEALKPGALPNKFIANLPYQVAATLILKYLMDFKSIQSVTVMVQSEVADRILAQPNTKSYGAYTAKLALLVEPAGRFQVPPHSFYPAPRVSSSVIRLNRRVQPEHPVSDKVGADRVQTETQDRAQQNLREVHHFIDTCFAQRRKTLRNNLKAAYSVEILEQGCQRCGIDPTQRAESLSPTQFVELFSTLESLKETWGTHCLHAQ